MKEFHWGKPMERSHWKIVAVSLLGSELPSKIGEGKEGVGVVKTFLILPVAAFNLAVVTRSIRTDEFVTDSKFRGSLLK